MAKDEMILETKDLLGKIAKVRGLAKGNELRKLYKSVFSGSAGDKVLLDLCRRYHIASSTVSVDPGDKISDVREGERRAVLYILMMVYSPLEAEKEAGAKSERT
jgi:hypothetical protein